MMCHCIKIKNHVQIVSANVLCVAFKEVAPIVIEPLTQCDLKELNVISNDMLFK